MAEQKQDVGSLSAAIDYSKLPLYGASEEQIKELQNAQQAAITALEQRYAQPNLFKVAAGFLKPQLGGFGASLGSASEALGENIEQQRAQALPIAQMRAQLAQSNLLLSSSTRINDEIKQWMAEHPGQTPPANKIMEWRAKAPQNPTVQALSEQQKLTMEQQAQQLQTAKSLYDAGKITKDEYGRRVQAIEQFQSPTGAIVSPVSTNTPRPKISEAMQYTVRTDKEAIDLSAELEKTNQPFNITVDPSIPSNVPTLEETGLSGPQATAAAGEQAAQQRKFDNERLALIATSDQQSLNRQNAALGRSAKILTDPNVQKSLGQLAQAEPGLLKAFGDLIQKGVHVSAGATDVGSFHAGITADVDNFMRNLKTDPKTATKIRELMMNIMTEARSEVRSARTDIGGPVRQSEFFTILGNVPQASDPSILFQKYILLRSAENTLNQNLYDDWQNYQNTKDHLTKPASAFFQRPAVREAYKTHKKYLDQAHNLGE